MHLVRCRAQRCDEARRHVSVADALELTVDDDGASLTALELEEVNAAPDPVEASNLPNAEGVRMHATIALDQMSRC